MRGQTYVIFTIVFIIIITVFALTNTSSVEVNYLFWSGKSPLILVILFSVLLGCIVTAIAGSVKIIRLQREIKKLKVANDQKEAILQENKLVEEDKPEE
ncbi:LapA family protein [Virgibacillus sp. W0181]|uniref:LapA family protein n=1 Tax=Virgibacillus sp. W0181 TaxID=3391581 RepID=UPI003F462C6E